MRAPAPRAQSVGGSSSRPLSPARAGRLVERAYAALWAERTRAAETEDRLRGELCALAEQRDRAAMEARRLRRAAGASSGGETRARLLASTRGATSSANNDDAEQASDAAAAPRWRRISSAPSMAWSDDDDAASEQSDDDSAAAQQQHTARLVMLQRRAKLPKSRPGRVMSFRGGDDDEHSGHAAPMCASLAAPPAAVLAAFFAAIATPLVAAFAAAAAPCAALFAHTAADVAVASPDKARPRRIDSRASIEETDADDAGKESSGECATPA
jgi:hypothetical protein